MTYGRRQDLLGEWTMDRPNACVRWVDVRRSQPVGVTAANNLGRHRVLVNGYATIL
jgi:hypothetical protein